ncbi:hypothetical protein CHLRE_12g512300v5 [Chlamydomonas reinhardtii]|uniref:Lipoxygenase n=1 Tax=Chlamydomonas reinhardtii TaxID=3055 RepID=A0A2K3D2I6_CHLRE|nr:uncharacterized protein CHLRE_12g512300v5 [Chlamydomonas reinhardtii]PNW74735.1 hypothetical protein CHLRE_12g512300v5 [Chlamydomonas reinhardtii]
MLLKSSTHSAKEHSLGRKGFPLRSSGLGARGYKAVTFPQLSSRGILQQRSCFTNSSTEEVAEETTAVEKRKVVDVIMNGAHHARGDVAVWKASIESSAPLLGDTGTRLEIVVIDQDTDRRSPPISVDDWRAPVLEIGPGSSTARSGGSSGSSSSGWKREGRLPLPADFRTPGAVLVRKLATAEGDSSVDFIGTIKLVSANKVFHFPAQSWVSSEHGWRVFFEGTAYLPAHTPPSLRDERQRELQALQGTPADRTQPRRPADRIYWYQTYDDLSSAGEGGYRPALGADVRRPYPRRIATNRGATPGTPDRELPPPKGEKPWLPYDEQFSFDKAADFNGDTLTAALPAAFSFIAEAGDQRHLTWLNLLPTAVRGLVNNLLRAVFKYAEPPAANFDNFEDVLAFFGVDADSRGSSMSPTHLYPAGAGAAMKGFGAAHDPHKPAPFKTASGAWDFRLDSTAAAAINNQIAADRVGPVYDSATGGPHAGASNTATATTAFAATAAATAAGAPAAAISAPPQPGAPSLIGRLGSAVWQRLTNDPSHDINDLLYFPVPRVLDGRPDAWYADEEYGRQALAGFHPTAITALKQLPEAFGSAIRPHHVQAELQGSTLEQLVAEAAAGAKPRLYLIDHWDLSAYWQEAEEEAEAARKAGRKPSSAVQHAGRCLFYLRKDEATGEDAALVPIAIELAHPGTHKASNGTTAPLPPTAGLVYARSDLVASPKTLAVWRLAKAVFRSLDSSIHQLVAHFNRTHATMEPFLIAMRRQMSVMHPITKLMLPHFRYTLNINRNARASLINAGGIIEKTFSAGPFAMRLASAVYGKSWTFAGQALPVDLRERGMVDAEGRPWLDYPFAIDGLGTWAALTAYFEEYVALYYAAGDAAVVEDAELQAWWNEVKIEGHPDLVAFGLKTEQQVWGFTGPIARRSDLVHVLATIAWLASGHHAAVNFGQYDFTGLVLNASSLVRRPMPAPGDAAYQELTGAALGPPQEKVFMTYLADPFSAVQVLATVKLLSAHARDEHTLDEANDFIVDPAARAANRNFIAAVKHLESVIETRNADPTNWARYGLAAGTAAPLPYTLLMASSPPGVTMRGVPYSVSI